MCVCVVVCVRERLAVAGGEFAAVSPRGRGTNTYLLKGKDEMCV